MIRPEQIRGARAMLGLKQQELADKAGLSMGTLNNIERGAQTDPKISTLRAIQAALEAEGIEFTGDDTDHPGLCLHAPRRDAGMTTLLIIDDSARARSLYAAWLSRHRREKYTIVTAGNAQEGYEMFVEYRPQAVILDVMLYGLNGFQTLVATNKQPAKIPPLVFLSATPVAPVKRKNRGAGVTALLDKKSLTKEKLCAALAKALVW